MALSIAKLRIIGLLAVFLVSSCGYAQRRGRLRRPSAVNYGRILTMIKNSFMPEFDTIRNEFNAKLDETKKQLDGAILEIRSLEKLNQDFKTENKRLSNNLQELSDSSNEEFESMQSANFDMRQQIESLQESNAELNKTLITLEKDREMESKTFETTNSEMRDQIASLQYSNSELNKTLTMLEKVGEMESKTFEMTNSEMRDKIDSLQYSNSELNKTLTMLEKVGEIEPLIVETVDVGVQTDFHEDTRGREGSGYSIPLHKELILNGMMPAGVTEEHVEQPDYVQGLRDEMIQSMSNTRHELAKAIYPPCDFVYQGHCYFAEVHYYTKVDYADAETICASRHATVAYPVNEEHFTKLLYDIRSKMPDGLRYVYVWIGIKQNPKTGDITTPDGEEAPFLKWYSGQPSKGPDETRAYIYVTKDARDGRQGMFDDYDGYEFHGAVCRYKFPPLGDSQIASSSEFMDWYTVQNDDKLYRYKLFMKKLSYKSAVNACMAQGTLLASAGMRIANVRSEVLHQVVKPGGEDTWAGLDNFSTGQWGWNDGQISTRSDTDWKNYPGDDGVECAYMKHGTLRDFKLEAGQCWKEYFYICEKVEENLSPEE